MSMLPADTHRRLFHSPIGKPEVWFMFENHSFARVAMLDRAAAREQIVRLFQREPHGTIFTKNPHSVLHGRPGVAFTSLSAWLYWYYANTLGDYCVETARIKP